MKKIITFFSLFFTISCLAQAGLTVSPGKLYFYENNKLPQTQKISITNPTNNYTNSGTNNITDFNTLEESCSSWIQILPNTFFTIEPNVTKDIEVILTSPDNINHNTPVHTSMLFFTQLNPGDSVDEKGASIKVTVRMGVKVYHAKENTEGEISINNFRAEKDLDDNKFLELDYENTGEIWTEGKISWSIFDYKNGKTTELIEEDFYTLPKDHRTSKLALDNKLKSGKYLITAQITYGKNETIQLAEMDIEI